MENLIKQARQQSGVQLGFAIKNGDIQMALYAVTNFVLSFSKQTPLIWGFKQDDMIRLEYDPSTTSWWTATGDAKFITEHQSYDDARQAFTELLMGN